MPGTMVTVWMTTCVSGLWCDYISFIGIEVNTETNFALVYSARNTMRKNFIFPCNLVMQS